MKWKIIFLAIWYFVPNNAMAQGTASANLDSLDKYVRYDLQENLKTNIDTVYKVLNRKIAKNDVKAIGTVTAIFILIALVVAINAKLNINKLNKGILDVNSSMNEIKEKMEKLNKAENEKTIIEPLNEIAKAIKESGLSNVEIASVLKELASQKFVPIPKPEIQRQQTNISPSQQTQPKPQPTIPMPLKNSQQNTSPNVFYLGLPDGNKIKNEKFAKDDIFAFLECYKQNEQEYTFTLTNKCYERLSNNDVYNQMQNFCNFSGNRFEMKVKKTTKAGMLKIEGNFYKLSNNNKAEVEL